jgi:hypothetical protein
LSLTTFDRKNLTLKVKLEIHLTLKVKLEPTRVQKRTQALAYNHVLPKILFDT